MPKPVRFSVKKSLNAEEMKRQITEAATKATYDIADQIFSVSQEKAPIDIGMLRKSGVVKYGPGPRAEIRYTSAHAKPIHFGTKPHMPPVGPLEGWAGRHGMPGAGWAIAKKIAKEGTKAIPFLQDAINEVLPRVKEVFGVRIRAALKR